MAHTVCMYVHINTYICKAYMQICMYIYIYGQVLNGKLGVGGMLIVVFFTASYHQAAHQGYLLKSFGLKHHNLS